MTFRLSIETDNAAFAEDEEGGPARTTELARILRDLAETLDESYEVGWTSGNLRDINGNHVGEWSLT